MFKIGFTGHRNCVTTIEVLDDLVRYYKETFGQELQFIHGGALGFDTQVNKYAKHHGIATIVHIPDYVLLPWNVAPLKRNEKIVDQCDVLVACYDGRTKGGTYYTIQYAIRHGKFVNYIKCININEDNT